MGVCYAILSRVLKNICEVPPHSPEFGGAEVGGYGCRRIKPAGSKVARARGRGICAG